MKLHPLVVLLVLALAGCQAMPDLAVPSLAAKTDTAKPAPPPPDPATQIPALEKRIAVLVAEQRLKLDPQSPALSFDEQLSTIARARAADMAAKNYLAHAAPNGDTSATLLMAADDKFQGLLGENLAAQHYTVAGGIDPDAFAQRFVDTWLGSAPHKENMTFPDYRRAGVGAALNGDTVYVALLFASEFGVRQAGDDRVTPLEHPGDAKPPADAPADPLRLRGAIGAGN